MNIESVANKEEIVKATKAGTLFGGTLLVAGTSIGGGMLALPVLTSLGGFFPAVVIYFLCWLFMACTGLLLMEVYLWMEKDANIISMAKRTLGKTGKYLGWILYLFLFYSLTIAYVSGGGHLVADAINVLFPHMQLSGWLGAVVFVTFFAPFVFIGARAVDRINLLLMTGLVITFLAFVVLGFGFVDNRLLTTANIPLAILATPVVFTSFGFQGMIPTLTNYMQRDPWKTKLVIWWGSAIPLITYIVWEWLILGIVPLDTLKETLQLGETAVFPLRTILNNTWVYSVGQLFAFFAIVTSFLGVTLGLLDFLADGLKVKKTRVGRLSLCSLIFIPPLAFALTSPRLFLVALDFAGGFGCALLLGLLPIIMVWSGRYILKLKSEYSLPGGKITLSMLSIFVLVEIAVMLYK